MAVRIAGVDDKRFTGAIFWSLRLRCNFFVGTFFFFFFLLLAIGANSSVWEAPRLHE